MDVEDEKEFKAGSDQHRIVGAIAKNGEQEVKCEV